MKNLAWNALFLMPASIIRPLFGSKRLMSLKYGSSFAASRMDRIIEELVPYRSGFFIEIGGNDGITQSNTKWLELHKDWTGILVEPFKPNFRRMGATRSARTHKFHGACVPRDYEHAVVQLQYADLMTVSSSLESDLESRVEHVQSGLPWIRTGSAGREFSAPALRLNDLLVECNAPSLIDFFSLDVEGAEIPVLKGVDHQTFKFKFLLVESRSPMLLQSYLETFGYKLVRALSVHDYLFAYDSGIDSQA